MNNRRVVEKRVLRKEIKHFINQLLFMVLMFLLGVISVSVHPNLKDTIRKNVFEKSFSFLKVRNIYDKYFSSKNVVEESNDVVSVFQEKLFYSQLEEIDGGVKLKVEKDSSIPMLKDGLIVFMGEKNEVPTIIVDLVDGVSITYQYLLSDQKKMYDFVESGDVLGRVDGDTLLLYFEKEGKEISYKEYI